MQYLDAVSKTTEWSVCFQGKPLNITVIQVYAPITDAKAEAVLWPPHEKSWLFGKDPDAGRDWRQEEKGSTEDEMSGWHHWRDGHEFEWTLGVGDWQGGLVCCDSWGCKESDTTEQLNWRLPESKPFCETTSATFWMKSGVPTLTI